MSRSAVRVILGILLGLLLLAGIAGALVWWKISSLKEQLVTDLGNAIGAEVQISSLDLDLWKGELHAAGISLLNVRAAAPWEKGEISQAVVRFHLSDLLASPLPVSVEVSSWNVVLRPQTSGSTGTPLAPIPSSGFAASGSTTDLPSSHRRIQVTQISAEEGSVEIDLSYDKKVSIQGVAFQASDNGAGVWTTELQASSLTAGSLEAGVSSVQIRGEQDKITFSNLRMACGQGLVTGDGDMTPTAPHVARVDLKAVDIPVTMLVAVAWQMKLSGTASGDLHYEGSDMGGAAKGQLAVNQGKFNVLPWLGNVTAMVGLPDISNVEVDKATADFEWRDRAIHLTNIDVRKNDVSRIAGGVDIDSEGRVDGRIKLGLPSTVTAKWPQLQDKVFSVQSEDYNWADVRLTGTPDHLQEDLTPRLLAVGMGQGTDLLNQAAQKATDIYNSFMGK